MKSRRNSAAAPVAPKTYCTRSYWPRSSLFGAAIEMPHVAGEIDPGGIDDVRSWLRFAPPGPSASSLPQTVPASDAPRRPRPAGVTKSGLSITSGLRHSTHSPRDSRIAWFCAVGEANVLLVVDHPPRRLDLAQELTGAVGRSVVDEDDFEVAIVLRDRARRSTRSRYCAEFQVTMVTETIGL